MTRILVLIGFILLTSLSADAQTFDSGSTGADGALDLTSGDRTVQLPESGILNYTTVNIPAGRILRFARNSRNTPVHMLAQGAVVIAGQIIVSAPGGPAVADAIVPGPGGFYGGQANQPGFGPGGGQVDCANRNGRWVGPLSLVPLIGGSGSAGIFCFPFDYNIGGGGGGAIVIASSTSIVMTSGSVILADGGGIYSVRRGDSCSSKQRKYSWIP